MRITFALYRSAWPLPRCAQHSGDCGGGRVLIYRHVRTWQAVHRAAQNLTYPSAVLAAMAGVVAAMAAYCEHLP